MKIFFLSIWFVLSLAISGLTLLFAINDFSLAAALALASCAFYSFCFYRLIREAYPNEMRLNSGTSFWVGWIILPLGCFCTYQGLQVLITGVYTPSHRDRLLNKLAMLLAEHVGAWVPGLFAILIGLAFIALSVRLIASRRQY